VTIPIDIGQCVPHWPTRPVGVAFAPSIAVHFAAHVTRVEDRGPIITVHMVVGERNTGRPFEIVVNVSNGYDTRPRHVLIREAIKQALMHELDESIIVDGHRPFDPHANEPAGFFVRFDTGDFETPAQRFTRLERERVVREGKLTGYLCPECGAEAGCAHR